MITQPALSCLCCGDVILLLKCKHYQVRHSRHVQDKQQPLKWSSWSDRSCSSVVDIEEPLNTVVYYHSLSWEHSLSWRLVRSAYRGRWGNQQQTFNASVWCFLVEHVLCCLFKHWQPQQRFRGNTTPRDVIWLTPWVHLNRKGMWDFVLSCR